MSSSTSSIDYTKLIVSGITSVAIDTLVFKQSDMKKSLMLGGATVAGFAAASMISSILPLPDFNLGGFASGKTVMQRVEEIGLGFGATYYINKSVLNNESYDVDYKKRILSLVVSDVVGTYASEYLNNQPLNYIN